MCVPLWFTRAGMWWFHKASLQNLAQVVLEWHWSGEWEASKAIFRCFAKVWVNELAVLFQCSKSVCREAKEAGVRNARALQAGASRGIASPVCPDPSYHGSCVSLLMWSTLSHCFCPYSPSEKVPSLSDQGRTEPVGQTSLKQCEKMRLSLVYLPC